MTCVYKHSINTKWKLLKSPGDGHCLMHSVVSSWNQQLQRRDITLHCLMSKIFIETVINTDLYLGFVSPATKLFTSLRRYLINKSYDNDFCDIVPLIIANALQVNLHIINVNSIQTFDDILISCNGTSVDTILIYRCRDHYDAVQVLHPDHMPVMLPENTSFEPPDNSPVSINKTSPLIYSSNFLRSLNSHGKVSRKTRKLLFRHNIWKPNQTYSSEWIKSQKLNRRKRGGKSWTNVKAKQVCLRKSNPNNLIHIEINKRLHGTSSLNYMLYNTRSVVAKPLAINELVAENDLDILCICETWIQPGDDAKVNEMCPNNFAFYGKSRNSRGGGVGILVKDNIHVKENDYGHFSSFEYYCATLHLEKRKMKIVTVYRPPSSSTIREFCEEFETLLTDITMFAGSIVIGGDFNIHVNKLDHTEVCQFIDVLESFGLHQHIKESTHNQGNTIDLVISRAEDDIIRSINVRPRLDFISDHHPISCILNIDSPPPGSMVVKQRSFRKINLEQFAYDLVHRLNCMGKCENFPDVNNLETSYTSCVTEVLEVMAPWVEKKVKSGRKCYNPWYNDTIHQQRQLRRSLERRWRKTKLLVDWEAYEKQYQHVVQIIEQSKAAYYHDKLKSSQKDAHKVVKNLLYTRNVQLPSTTSDMELADMFIKFFVNKVIRIRSSLDQCTPDQQVDNMTMHGCPYHLSSFSPISENDLHKIIMKLKTKSCMIDPVPTYILKEDVVLDALLPYLTTIVNESLISGIMPDGLKTALIYPHLKKQGLDPDVLSNYRPVSNLPFLGKVIEKCVALQLCQHMSTHDLGDRLQSAYKETHSTETALLRVKRDCDNAIDSGKSVLLVLLDLSAAFDTIDHNILLDRLQTLIGVKSNALKWFKSYISGRLQKVVIRNSISEQVPLDVGVPQGSVLGPLLFLLYILPLGRLIKKYGVSYHGYADDTQLYIEFDPKSEECLATAINTLETCISEIRNWMVINKLKLNDDKTELQIVASPHHYSKILASNPSIRIGDSIVHPSATVKNLGVIVDSNLHMKRQITSVTRSMYFHMRGIRHIRHYLDIETLKKAVMTLVISRLDYANSLLAGITNSGLHRLQVAQNCAARLVTSTPKTDHITPILYTLHWLPVYQRIKYKGLYIVYRCLNDPAMPSYLTCLFSKYVPSRALRSMATNTLTIQRTKTNYGHRRFETWASTLWNVLPIDIKSAPSIAVFKRQLKTFLFIQHFNDAQ